MRNALVSTGNAAPRQDATVELSVDQHNVIVSVNAAWDDFAHDNEGAHLAQGSVLGSNLLDAISGRVSKNFTLTLLELARRRERDVIFDYRCDSPRLRRFMRAHMHSDEIGVVHYFHQHLYSEAFPHLVAFKTATQRGRGTLMRCSICNHVRQAGLWRTPESCDSGVLNEVIYGVCPSCEQMLKEC